MTEFTKAKAQILRTQIQVALNEANIKGTRIDVGNCKYTGGQATYQVKVVLEGGKTKEQIDLEFYSNIYKIDTDKVTTLHDGNKYQVVGYNSRARKNPWVILRVDNQKQYVINAKTVENNFKIEETVQ